MKNTIVPLIENILSQAPMLDDAEAEFKRMIGEDPDLRRAYRDWCHEMGYTERNGFRDYCQEYLDGQNEIWDYLTDYDNEE